MAGSTNGIIHRVRHLLRQSDSTPDAELLERFVADRDGDAFALLVRRHGPMVHGVCRRVLRNAADADDAFQATFLVLARRARSVRPQSLLGNWLYGVAYRTSLEAQRAAAVRRMRERKAAQMKALLPATEAPAPDLREVLDRELAALPDAFRAAIVLCDLEGLSRRDAALRLGWSEGTLSGRLFRARSLLATRLSRLGLAIPAAGLAFGASVPAALAESTVRLGVLFAAGEAVSIAAAPVAALTEGVMKAMLLTKLKGMATALVVGCAVFATTAAGWRANAVGAADGQAREEPARRTAPRDPDKDRIAQLERERDELLKLVFKLKVQVEKLEANQRPAAGGAERPGAAEDFLRLTRAKDEKQKLLEAERAKQEAERARDRATPLKPTDLGPAELFEKLEKLRKLEEELAKTAKGREKVKDPTSDLAEKLKALELGAATAAKMKAELERERVTKVKQPEGDRVAALEARVKKMELIIDRLQAELDRVKKK